MNSRFHRCLALFALNLMAAPFIDAMPAQRFEPLKDTLVRYGILKTPEPSDYPGVPAVAVLSVREYRQIGRTHVRLSHEILKILTAAGKSYTTIKVPCYTECRVEGRTIKPDGRIINVPARDLVRSRQFTGYDSPFSFTQFAVPGVEPGDIVEIKTTIPAPVPLFMEDFRFSRPYPVVKAVLLLSHPADYAYTYFLQGKAGQVHVSKGTMTDGGIEFFQTLFDMDNVPASPVETYSSITGKQQPGVRFLMSGRSGSRFEVFKDWFSFGKFVSDMARIDPLTPKPVSDFVKEAVGNESRPAEILRLIYQAADRRILIGRDTLVESGFDFAPPEKSFERRSAQPHEFALFLALCFRTQKWSSEFVLINSHDLPETSKETPFPLDLDLVFLNVKTPFGEFLLDCSKNGIPSGVLSSSAMNRFALVIPILTGSGVFTASPYLTAIPFRAGNTNHIEMILTPGIESWTLEFRWFLGGELQAPWISKFRQEGEAAFLKDFSYYVRTHLRAAGIKDVRYQWLAGGMEISGKASVSRTKIGTGLELAPNNLWDSGFNFRQYLFEDRVNLFLLPMAGVISSTLIVKLEPGMNPVLPAAGTLESKPVKYVMSIEKTAAQVTLKESITISDLLVQPAAFTGFVEFLDKYYASHFWSLLLISPSGAATGGLQ